jgi:hypothetical protein
LQWRLVAEAFESGVIIVVNELVEKDIAIGVICEQAVACATFGLLADGFGDAAVEALDHAIGLRLIGSCQPVVDAGFGADTVEGVAAGRFAIGLVFHVHGEAVGELGAVVGENGMRLCREMTEEALEESRGGLAVAAGMDLQIDIAGGAVDGDEGIGFAPLQRGQMF